MEQLVTKNLANADVYKVFQAPRVGLEPTTPRLTAACSTIELSRIILFLPILYTTFAPAIFLYRGSHVPSKLHTRNSPLLYLSILAFPLPLGHALDRLVAVSFIHYCTSTSALSTSSSSRGLTTFVGISHLEGGFTLRCLQRLSRPGLATLPWPWSANRYTSGQSIPVLSY